MSRLKTSTKTKQQKLGKYDSGWRRQVYTVIFESDTPMGLLFDRALIGLIIFSVLIVILDSVEALHNQFGAWFLMLEWGFTVIFTTEYLLRLLCLRHPWRYANSFFGWVDFISILPTYIALFFPPAHALIDVRALRLLRIFRIFRLAEFINEYQAMTRALLSSGRKILIFLSVVLIVTLLLGTTLYVIEGKENGFTSIPTSLYWAITTVTTVGFGDITPKTDIGRIIASIVMLIGWGTLVIPTGIVTSEFTAERNRLNSIEGARPHQVCAECLKEDHAADAVFCRHCGASLPNKKDAI